jgi:hypothetical protein
MKKERTYISAYGFASVDNLNILDTMYFPMQLLLRSMKLLLRRPGDRRLHSSSSRGQPAVAFPGLGLWEPYRSRSH